MHLALVKTTNQAFIVWAGSASSYNSGSTHPQSLPVPRGRAKIMLRWSLAWRLKVEELHWIVAIQAMCLVVGNITHLSSKILRLSFINFKIHF